MTSIAEETGAAQAVAGTLRKRGSCQRGKSGKHVQVKSLESQVFRIETRRLEVGRRVAQSLPAG